MRDAAPGYLSGPQRATADPATWFSSALAYATQQLRGATAALIPVAGPGMGTITGYTVADYLLQNAQVVRRHIPPPASFWDAVVAQTTNAVHRITLAHDAKERGLYWYVVALLAPAAEVGDINGMLRLASWLDWTGHSEEAGGWWHCAAQTGNPDAMWALAEWLEWTGRGEEAEEWRRRVAETGDTNPLRRTLGEARKDREEAENRLCRAAETGDLQSLGHLSGWRRRAAREGWEDPYRFWEAFRLWRKNGGSVEDVHLFWRRQAEAGDPKAMRGLATSLERMGRSEEAEEWRLRVATRTGGAEDMWAYAGWLDSVGRGEEADEWRRRTGESGDPAIMWMLAWWLQRVGRGDEAEYWWRRAAEAGEYNAMWTLAWWLQRVGRGDEAARLRRYGIEPGGSTASPWTAPNAMPMS